MLCIFDVNKNVFIGEVCAAKFVDDQWYRAKVEKITGTDVQVLYIDYGNRDTVPRTKCGALPGSFTALPAFAKEYALALLAMPPDVSIFSR
jgi:staphylococcal nuclease domain-containing protein 1